MQPDLFASSTARFSPCRRYRYELWRRWDVPTAPFAMFIGLNPSTADETADDPTIRRCIRFARDWGFGGLLMTNLFAFRATDPAVMKAEAEPVGPENNPILQARAIQAGIVIAAWGVHGVHLGRDKFVMEEMDICRVQLKCLGVTADGQPRHPLYMPANATPIPYP